MIFTRHRGGVRADVDNVEALVLAQCAGELLELLGEPVVHRDPLAELVGMPADDVPVPEDPVLARLLPSAYRDDDEASHDFRRYTDADLRATKRAAAQAVLASLPAGGGKLKLDRDQADQWLTCLNDVRLAIGTALEVDEDTDDEELAADDPRAAALDVYGWLGFLQESLLSCLEPRHAG